MLLFVSFPSCLLAISITKTHNFIIIGCSPRPNYAIFSNIFFGLRLKFYSQISNYTAAKAQTCRKCCCLNILSESKDFTVTAHFSAVHKQKQNEKIVTLYHVLTLAPRSPTHKQKTDHIKRVIISNCTKFLKYSHKILLLEIIQNTSSTTCYFF